MEFEPINQQEGLSTYPIPYFSIAAAVIAGLLWYIFPSLGALPLLVGVAPWFIEGSTEKNHTVLLRPYGPLLGLFLLTAFLGVWLAYDRSAAWSKFWILIDAILLFYALANVQWPYLWSVVRYLSLAGALIAVYFLMTHNWHTIPGGIGFIDGIAHRWMNIRPNLGLPIIHPNKVAGIFVMILPYTLAAVLYEWRQQREIRFFLMAACVSIMGIGLLMTASRGGVIALMIGLTVWMLWSASKQVGRIFHLPQSLVYAFIFIFPAIFLVLLLLLESSSRSLVANLLDAPTIYSRASLFRDSLNLAAAFPFTGAGLATFPGLYSQYIQRIPFPFYYYGHNLYLDLLLEQGPIGLLTFIGLWSGAGYHLWVSGYQQTTHQRKQVRGLYLLRWAAFSSMVIVTLHGLVDDAFYSERGMPLLFLTLGMILAISIATSKQRPIFPRILPLAGLVVLFIGLGSIVYRPTRAAWYENIAAVRMAHMELANWPTGRWYDNSYADSLAPSKTLLETAVTLNPENSSAQYRLGHIALLAGDFETAIKHLEIAYQHNRRHPGIQKALAYSYTWAGQIDKALPLFAHIPQSAREIATYAELWRKENREDLAAFAVEMGEQLNAADVISPEQ